MGFKATRCYNNSPEQIRAALEYALRVADSGFQRLSDGSYQAGKPLRIGLFSSSYGERITVRMPAAGQVDIESRYIVPTQVFEFGDNVSNCIEISELVATHLRTREKRCASCSAEVAGAGWFCTGCGQELYADELSWPLPRKSMRVVAINWLIVALLMLAAFGAFVLVLSRI